MFNDTVELPPCPFSDSCHIVTAIDYERNPTKYLVQYLPGCPLECDSIQYNTRLSSQNYPSRGTYELFKQSSTNGIDVSSYTAFKKHFFKINVFYETLAYTYVTLSPKTTLVALLSNLGGSMGALLGFTLFTFFEALEILIQVVYILIFHK